MTPSGPTPATPMPASSATPEELVRRYIWWNFAAISVDVGCWMAGSACMDAGAVLPVFVSTLTRSTLLVAALAVLPGVGWASLQLVGVTQVMHRQRKLPYLLKIAALGRTPMLVMPTLLLFADPPRQVVLWALVSCYLLLFLTDGLIGAGWYDMIAKVIPTGLRGRLFAAMSVLSALGALAAGWVVRQVLASPHLPYPRQYGVLFAFMCLGLLLSFILLSSIREPAGPVPCERALPLRRVLAQVPVVWRGQPSLRRLLYVSWLGNLATMGWPFYVLYGMKALGLPAVAAAVFIWAGAAGSIGSSLFWGWISDHRGPRSVVVGVAALRAAPPLLAVAIPALGGLWPALGRPPVAQYTYALVFLFAGALAGGGFIGFPHYLLEVASPEERPLYVGLGNTLSAPGLLAPVLGGWLVGAWSYPAVFALAAAWGVAGLLVSLGLEAVGGKTKPDSLPA